MNFNAYPFNKTQLETRIASLIANKPTESNWSKAMQLIFSCIDLTTLEATDNADRIAAFCEKALAYKKDNVSVAALCIYSPFLKQAKALISASGLQLATVACAFPTGQMPLDLKLKEVEFAVAQGADEVDMVISRGTFLQGDYDTVFEEIKAVKKACGKAHLKVILETGELETVENIRKASEIALLAGADFLKTSTGKVSPAATPLAAVVMLDSIAEYFEKSGKKVGFKPAGGIADPETAYTYYQLVKGILGEDWLNNKLFRIGASRLADKVFGLIKA
ncbi:MAG: deoxyribose-phosphate aldolase [Bacteroidales bacterium]|nr:deoxyribose-phosphate aldolase [Bacteroidales bacterium]